MTPIEITKIVDAITKKLEPWVKDYLDKQTREIPHMIREEVRSSLDYDVRNSLRDILEDRVEITVTVKDRS